MELMTSWVIISCSNSLVSGHQHGQERALSMPQKRTILQNHKLGRNVHVGSASESSGPAPVSVLHSEAAAMLASQTCQFETQAVSAILAGMRTKRSLI